MLFDSHFASLPSNKRMLPAVLLLGATGLLMLGSFQAAGMLWLAVTIYGLGKTFLWPTMLVMVFAPTGVVAVKLSSLTSQPPAFNCARM
jgi:hypothetical protein